MFKSPFFTGTNAEIEQHEVAAKQSPVVFFTCGHCGQMVHETLPELKIFGICWTCFESAPTEIRMNLGKGV